MNSNSKLKLLILLSLSFIFTSISIDAQQLSHIGCKSAALSEQLEARYPGIQKAMDGTFEVAKHRLTHRSNTNEIYTIPIVFHILWKDSVVNISEELINDQLEVLNEEMLGQHSDLNNIRSIFVDRVGIPNLQFEVVEIIRVQTENEFQSSLYLPMYLDSLIKSTANGGSDAWDPSKYVNIWVCDLQNLRSAWGYPPIALSQYPDLDKWEDQLERLVEDHDGIVIDYRNIGGSNRMVEDYTGEILNTEGRVLIHELGHYFGLRHIWGDAPPMGVPGWDEIEGCSDEWDDGIDDTPDAWFSTINCDPSIDDCTEDDLPNMWENYMDYSIGDCFFTFTQEQVELMRAIIEGPRSGLLLYSSAHTPELSSNHPLKIWPNPTSGAVNISMEDAQRNSKAQVRIIDGLGKTVMQTNTFAPQESVLKVQLPKLANGIYYLDLTIDNQRYVERLSLLNE